MSTFLPTGIRSALAKRAKRGLAPAGRARMRLTVPVATHVHRLDVRPEARQERSHSSVARAAQPAGDQSASTSLSDISPSNAFDIVIIGAGNAGLALAATLLSKPSLSAQARILLVDAGSLDKVRSWTGEGPWENRVSSLTAENVAFLRDIGAWKHIVPSRSCSVDEMIVWTSSDSNSSSTIAFPTMSLPMAHMTENTNLQHALLRRIEEAGRGRVVVKEGARVQDMKLAEGGRWVGLKLGENEWVRGSVVVGADGPNSPVRTFSDIDSFGHAYNTHGVVATIHHAPMSNHTAYQRFLPTGPIAFLPLSDTTSTLVWSTTPELAKKYKLAGPEALAQLVTCAFYASEADLQALNASLLYGDTVDMSQIEQVTQQSLRALATADLSTLPPPISSVDAKSIASFPLKLSHAESYVGNRTVLIGDAAHTIHPLAGQGLNMGLADVRSLANVWEQTVQRGGDIGSYTAMLPYSRERYPANHLLLSTTDKLHHLFRNRIGLVNWARGLGMDVINELGPVKKALMERAGASPAPAGRTGGMYSTAANGLEGWQTVKGMAGLVAGVGKQAVQNGARRLLERMAK